MFTFTLLLHHIQLFRLQFRHPTTHEMIPRTLLLRQLEHIVNAVRDVNSTAPPVGLFTGLPRDAWGQLNTLLRQNSVNSEIFADLEHSLFILCLDDMAHLPTSQPTSGPITLDPRETASAANLLHGNLTNSGNRWFDKTLQFIISRDGSMGVNFEHTPSDAGAFVPITSDVYTAFDDLVTDASGSLPHFAFPKELDWIPFPNMTEEIAVAYDSLKQLIASVQIEYGMFRQFGSSGLKPFKVSPDAFVQVALQLTYARLHPDLPPPPTYESGSLRRFHLGRTDTIRSCSQATVQFTQSMRDNHSKLQERAELLRVALQRHQDFTRNLIAGHAFDRHLFGLRQISITSQISGEDTQEITNFFTDPTYTSSLCYRLSTSQVRAPNDVSVLFGPVDSNGYGVCYNIHRDAIQISASAFRSSNQTTHPSEFLTHFAHALSDMYGLLKAHTV
ncbi:unnamed protein product [Dicrocoelium dendriticum]|nr:unnamed protein product [Dicrocoelium dendriticum]